MVKARVKAKKRGRGIASFDTSSSPPATHSRTNFHIEMPPIHAIPAHLVPPAAPPLSDVEKAELPAFRARIPDLLKALHGDAASDAYLRDAVFCSDACLVRYLRSVKHGSVDAALARLKHTLEWRASYKPYEITPKDVEPEAVTGKLYVDGFDAHGRPVVYMLPFRENSTDWDRMVRHLVFNLEMAIRLLPETGDGKVCLLIDYSSFKNNVPMGVSKRVLDILQNHYVERLGVAMMHDAPAMLSVFWKIISPFLDPVTKGKIHFTKKGQPFIKETVPSELLEQRYGGDNTFDYKHEDYWPSVEKLWEEGRKKDLAAIEAAAIEALRSSQSTANSMTTADSG